MIPVTSSGGTPRGGGPTVVAEVDREVFVRILKKTERPLVLRLRKGVSKPYKYLTRHAGYFFLTKSKEPLDFSREAEVIEVQKLHTSLDWPVV